MESVLFFSQLILQVHEPRCPGLRILQESIIDISAEKTGVEEQRVTLEVVSFSVWLVVGVFGFILDFLLLFVCLLLLLFSSTFVCIFVIYCNEA